ncbi:MAG: NFACT RNA binding domain-containing protein [Acholeplasmatales bacterium]|jgi:predicted ribosome quality control (RQC) complex YloA/Tae2 family protein|nr:NFACT RNA binding domain-containing protein [Acholeplasmatales bacterium]
MAFDGFFLQNLIKELRNNILNARVNKIFSFQNGFVMELFRKKDRFNFCIDIRNDTASVYLTNTEIISKDDNDNFLVSLKKNFQNSVITSLDQHLSDRVLIISFENNNFLYGKQELKLIFEIMGKYSNLYIVKEDYIIDCYKKVFDTTSRNLIPKAKFEFLDSKKEAFDNISYNLISSPKDLQDKYMGISSKLATYLFENRVQLCDIADIKPILYNSKDYYCFNYLEDEEIKCEYNSFSELLYNNNNKENTNNKKYIDFVNKKIAKINKKIINIENDLIIYQNNSVYQRNANRLFESGIDLNSHINNYEDIKLDKRRTVIQNINDFYKIHKKSKSGITHLNIILDELKKEIEVLEEFLFYIELSSKKTISEIDASLKNIGYKSSKSVTSKQKTKIPSFKKIIYNDKTILIGLNQIQNEYIVKNSPSNYTWFHVGVFPSAHLVINSQTLTEDEIRFCAMMTAYYSRARNSSSIPINYTLVKNLKKIPNVSGFLVSMKTYKTIYIDIIETIIEDYIK